LKSNFSSGALGLKRKGGDASAFLGTRICDEETRSYIFHQSEILAEICHIDRLANEQNLNMMGGALIFGDWYNGLSSFPSVSREAGSRPTS
jgi:hypothetical protein